MATILFAWELGEGLGHVAQIAPLAKEMSRRGHKVFAALRDISTAVRAFAPGIASLLQSPHRIRLTPNNTIAQTRTFAHILFNTGFGNLDELEAMTRAWIQLYEFIRPDLIVFDHSPTALLASRAIQTRRVLLGSGFFCPLDGYPLPDLWPFPCDQRLLTATEDLLLQHINCLLHAWQRPPLDRVSQLYSQVDENVLSTYAELDHYPGRIGATYYGDYVTVPGKPLCWPPGPGKRLFAYLKPFPALGSVLAWLAKSGHRVIVYGEIPPDLRQHLASPTLRFEQQPLDMRAVSAECDAGVLNANHSTTIALLRGGKPAFHIPRALEQWLFARAIARLGAGLDAAPNKADDAIRGMQQILGDCRFRQAAEGFARRYAGASPAELIARIVERLEQLIAGTAR